ncbi:hypothetical protein D9611_014502 [Ephemerocybe angulata]|uniref:ribonuclease H n=1 Tax=Ephemerocybe angulata TaxID=980116 RepID=A0A8H5FF54_9AGAR|nr:hypothetical protein D9611_014502 [Tulosesus angulatus]
MQRNIIDDTQVLFDGNNGYENNPGWGGSVEDHSPRADHRPDDPPGGRLSTPPPADDGDGGDAGARNHIRDVPGEGVPPANEGATNSTEREPKKRSRAAVRIASLNMRGGGLNSSREKWVGVHSLLREESLSILALQETHISDADRREIEKLYKRMRIFNSPDPLHPTSRGGVAIVLNTHKTNWKNAEDTVLVPGRAILVTLEWGNKTKLRILAVYAPSGNDEANKEFWEALEKKLKKDKIKIDVLLGDLNMVDSGLDRLPARADPAAVVDSFLSMTLSQHMHDGWRLANPSKLDYTFRTNPRDDGSTSHSRIDRIYVKEELVERTDEWRIMVTGLRTDHFMVSAYITTDETPFVGKGRCTIPEFLTDYKDVRQAFMKTAKEACSAILELSRKPEERTDERNVQTLWKDLKEALLTTGQESAKTRSTKLDRLIKKWEKRRKAILKVAEEDLENEEVLHLDEIEEELRELRAARILRKSTAIAAKHHALGESGTKYDYILHREQKPRDTIYALRKPGPGPPQYEKTTNGMVKLATEHHQALQDTYEHELGEAEWENRAQDVLSNLKPKVKEADRADMEAEITAGEVESAIMNIKSGKAAGLDGIPIEIWKFLLKGHPEEQQRDDHGKKTRVTSGIEHALAAVLNDITEYGVAPGGFTQFLTRVQGMPEKILKQFEKIADDLIHAKHGEEKSNTIGVDTIRSKIEEGGLRALDMRARNEAIEVMKLCTFLLPPELRPRWCEVAERILAENAILQFATRIGSNFLINPFIQGWRVNVDSTVLPDSLKRMMKVAEKYGAKFMPLRITQTLRKRMPYWFHWANKPQLVSQYYDKWAKCQQLNHRIKFVGEMLEHSVKGRRTNCKNRVNCKCQTCHQDRRLGCENPAQCRKNASLKLDNISPEWDPRRHDDDPENEVMDDLEPLDDSYNKAWRPDLSKEEWPVQLVRIFTKPDPEPSDDGHNPLQTAQHTQHPIGRRTRNSRRRTAGGARRDDIEVYTDGSCIGNGTDDAKCGSGVWYGPDDPRNKALRVDLHPRSNNVGELVAILSAVQAHANDGRLRVVSDSKYVLNIMTKHAQRWLDAGFIGVANKPIVRALIGELMHAKAVVYTKKVKGHSGDVGNDGADVLANEGAGKDQPDRVDLSRGEELEKIGAATHALTQAMAYEAIKTRKPIPPRRNTERMLERTKAVLEELTGEVPTSAAVWLSLRRRKAATISQKFGAYAWRTLHEGYKLGKYWDNIDELRDDRMPCRDCEVPIESMAHILQDCRVSGQETIWELAKAVWAVTGLEWPVVTLETVLGVGLLKAKNAEDKVLKGRTRLLQILISESAHLAWCIRCEYRIASKSHSREEVEGRWRAAISRRLRIDWTLANKQAYGKKALSYRVIEATWHNVASNRETIRSDLVATEVLVGSARPRRPRGRNR